MYDWGLFLAFCCMLYQDGNAYMSSRTLLNLWKHPFGGTLIVENKQIDGQIRQSPAQFHQLEMHFQIYQYAQLQLLSCFCPLLHPIKYL